MNFFAVYQFIVPSLLAPLSYWLWLHRYGGDHQMVFLALSLPVVFAYVIPGIGTNWLRLWEFNTRLRLGRFRPHHGLVFGTATSLFALVTLSFPGQWSIAGVLRDGFVLGSVLAFWNWLYDSFAIKSGFIKVYTRLQSEGASAEEIATDYAPILFGTFGFCYGISIRVLEMVLSDPAQQWMIWPVLAACHAACLASPVLIYITVSLLRTGETGLRSYERMGHEV